MIIISAFYTKLQLVVSLTVGVLLSFFILYLFSEENYEYINNIFIRSLGAFVFALILAFKALDNERDNYKFAKKIHEQTLYDHLTQVYNRRGYEIWKNTFLHDKQKSNNFHHCSVLMIDIDDFKKINDNYGHQVGDAVIQKLASILKNNAKQKSCIVRFGGEEFLIITPNASSKENLAFAENIRLLTQKHVFTNFDNKNFNITISIGAASSYESFHSMDKMLSLADNNLYKAKSKGKNLVVWK